MKYVIDRKKRPVYLQLYTALRDDIVNGLYPFGSKLPSKRALAVEAGVSTVTAEHALALLCDEGYASARERSGFAVTFRPGDGFAATTRGSHAAPAPTPKTQHTHPDFPPSVFSKTMRRVLALHNDILPEKSPNAGCTELRDAIARYLARNRGIRVNADQIVIGAGAEYLYTLIAVLLGKGRTFDIESPSYHKIEQVYRAAELHFDSLPLTANGIDSAALADTDADVLHTTPYRSYPSGVTASASKRHEYLSWVSKGERYIIEDDFQSEFSLSRTPEDTLFSQSKGEQVIYMNSFSKTISPSLRVAYMVLPRNLVPLYRERLGFLSCTVPTFQQLVLAALLRGGEFERHINRVRRKLRKALTTE